MLKYYSLHQQALQYLKNQNNEFLPIPVLQFSTVRTMENNFVCNKFLTQMRLRPCTNPSIPIFIRYTCFLVIVWPAPAVRFTCCYLFISVTGQFRWAWPIQNIAQVFLPTLLTITTKSNPKNLTFKLIKKLGGWR